MSIEASSFVLGLSMGRGNGLRKLILLGYANHADKHGRGAYPSTRTIADYAECDVRTVQRHIGWLLACGYLREGDQQMVDHLDPRYRPIVYDVAMTAEQIEQWAATAEAATGTRARASALGRRDDRASTQFGRDDTLSPLPGTESSQASRGGNVSPLQSGRRGDNTGGSGVTDRAVRGDTGVTLTVPEPSQEPSSSTPAPVNATVADAPRGGEVSDQSRADELDLLPETVRDHPSVIPSAIAKRVHILDDLGWSRAEMRRRLTGVETANQPGAATLARLTGLARLKPPRPPVPRPPWCGHCDQGTRMREDTNSDHRPYACPQCHPRTSLRDTPTGLNEAAR